MRTAIVLAGGRAKRMGLDKLSIQVGSSTLLRGVVDAALRHCDEVVVSGRRPANWRDETKVTFVSEDPPFGGPLAGLAAALEAFCKDPDDKGCESALVLAGDLANPDGAVQALAEATKTWPATAGGTAADAVILRDGRGMPQTLAGVYRLEPLRNAIGALETVRNGSLRQVLASLAVVKVDAPGRVTWDVDTPEDLQKLRDSRPLSRERYARNIALAGVGESGQRQLMSSRVLVVGAGGLGSAALPYLAAAGVGHIGIVDGDVVDVTNLQRQVLHVDVGQNKARSAAARLALLNPEVQLEVVPEMLRAESAQELFERYDLVLDCTDTFAAKFLISDFAQRADVPLIWASAVAMQGQCSVFGVPDCDGNKLWLRDLIPDEPSQGDYEHADHVGVLGPVVGQVGTLQATEAIKVLLGVGQPLVGRVAILDARAGRWRELALRKAPAASAEVHREDI